MEEFIRFCSENYHAMLWLLVMTVLVIVELSTVQMVCIWFALGALISSISAGLGASFTVQFAIFVTVSGVLLLFTRRFTEKLLHMRKTPTNADSVIGKCGTVLETIDNSVESGRIYVSGQDWAARTADNSVLHTGDTVLIEAIQGVKLIVVKQLR